MDTAALKLAGACLEAADDAAYPPAQLLDTALKQERTTFRRVLDAYQAAKRTYQVQRPIEEVTPPPATYHRRVTRTLGRSQGGEGSSRFGSCYTLHSLWQCMQMMEHLLCRG